MDSFPWSMFFCGLVSTVCLCDTSVLVRAPSPIVVTAEKEPLLLECSYRVTGSEVLEVNWYHRASTDEDFRIIVQIPNQDLLDFPPTFNNKRLSSKGKVTVRKMGVFTLVKLSIDPAECTDEGMYECEVRVYGGQASHKAKVQVHLNEEPGIPSLTQDPVVLVENHPATFTCVGSVGRPAGVFRWILDKSWRKGSHEEVEMTGITSFSKVTGGCSPIGTSTLAIVVTNADQKVKCVVKQQAGEGIVHSTEQRELNVNYRVTDTEVYTKVENTDLPLSREVFVQEGDHVFFVCRAMGNPRPKFNWSYLPFGGQTGLVHLLAQEEIVLKNIKVNQSGSYVCVATNHISNLEYSETRSVRVLVKGKFGTSQHPVNNGSSKVERYLLIGSVVTGALLFTVFVSLLSVMCIRRCSSKPYDQQVRYTGVTA